MRTNIEGAVHNRPWIGRAGGIDRLDAKQGGDDGSRSPMLDPLRERLRDIVGPHRQTALDHGTSLCHVTGRRLHRLLHEAGRARTEVELLRKDLDRNMERGQDMLHGRVPAKGDFVSAITQCKARRHEWLEVAAGATGRDHEDLAHRGYQFVAMYLVSRNSRSPSWEPSRPTPLCLTPPKGAAGSEMKPRFRPTIPDSIASATKRPFARSRV